MIIDRLCDKIIEMKNPSTIGIDTSFSYLPENLTKNVKTLEDASKAILEFNINTIDAIKDIAPSVKVQIAYYEMYGVDGLKTFAKTLEYAKSQGLIVIADAKRNDIGSTAGCYSSAYLGKVQVGEDFYTPFACDFLTVNGYLGSDGLKPFIEDCKKYDKGIFSLVKTSNPSSGELQDKKFCDGETLYESMGHLIQNLGQELKGKYGYSGLGAVVGATHKEQAEDLRNKFKDMFFLVPGYGAQGGKAEDLAVCFDERGLGGIVNSSRGIICAYKTDKFKGMKYFEASRESAICMKEDLLTAFSSRKIRY